MFSENKHKFRSYNRWILILILGCFIHSCTRDADIEPGPGLLDEYFPLEEGDIRTYVVDSITYDYDGELQWIVIDTLQYYFQERVLEVVELNGESWHRIGQFRSATKNGDYLLTGYVYERKTPERLLRKEGHLTFIPLASPLSLFDEWDGTAYFDASETTRFIQGEVIKPYEDWIYIYLQKWDNYTVEDEPYMDVLQINQRDTISIQSGNSGEMIPPENQLFYFLANEFYAPQVGLIEKEEYHLSSICASANVNDFQSFCDTTTIFQNAERGYIFHKKLISIE